MTTLKKREGGTMNTAAEEHLAKAKEYIAQGDEFYRKAKPEIDKALGEGASLREVSRYLDRSYEWVRQIRDWDGKGTLYGKDTERRQIDMAKQVLREKPEIVASLSVDEQRAIDRSLDEQSAKRQKAREQESKRKEREHLGDELVDDLELREELQKTEYLLIKARGDLRGFVKQINEMGFDNTPGVWRESCLDWIEDLEGHLSMARTLLTDGTIIDMTAFEELLKDA